MWQFRWFNCRSPLSKLFLAPHYRIQRNDNTSCFCYCVYSAIEPLQSWASTELWSTWNKPPTALNCGEHRSARMYLKVSGERPLPRLIPSCPNTDNIRVEYGHFIWLVSEILERSFHCILGCSSSGALMGSPPPPKPVLRWFLNANYIKLDPISAHTTSNHLCKKKQW